MGFRFARITAVVALFFGAVGCAPVPPDKKAAQAAYDRAKESLLRESRVEVDVVWLLQDILRMEPDRKLQQRVDAQLEQFAGHPYLLMVKPDAARIQLPSDPGRGIDRYFVYIQSAFGFPEDRAVRYVDDFVSKRERGYVLTHQLASLLWAEQTGLQLPESVWRRKAELMDQIYAEQIEQGHRVCVDLYAERVALLLRYGSPSREEAFDWIGKLVVSQREDGTWPDSNPLLEYDGQKATSKIPPSHTTALAMLALKCYILNY